MPAVEVHGLGSGKLFVGVHIAKNAHDFVDYLVIRKVLDAFAFVSLEGHGMRRWQSREDGWHTVIVTK